MSSLKQAIRDWLRGETTPEQREYGEACRAFRKAQRAAYKAGIYGTDTPELSAARARLATAHDVLAASRSEETTPETAAIVAILRGDRETA